MFSLAAATAVVVSIILNLQEISFHQHQFYATQSLNQKQGVFSLAAAAAVVSASAATIVFHAKMLQDKCFFQVLQGVFSLAAAAAVAPAAASLS